MDRDIRKKIRKIQFDPKHREESFLALNAPERAQVCLGVSKHLAYDLLSCLKDEDVLTLLEYLDPDEATDMIQLFPDKKRAHIVDMLSHDIKRAVETLLHFGPETAGGLMSIEYIQVRDDDTIKQVAQQFKLHEKRTGHLPAILVVAENGKLVGYLPGHELGFAEPNEGAKKYVRRIMTINHSASREDVAHVFREHPHNKVVVLGDSEQVLGVIYSDDVLRFLHEQEAASLYDFAGVHDEETISDTVSAKVRSRYKWLIINLGTAFLASFTVSLFDTTISKYVLLAVYMPIIAGMGGNAATQTLAIMVRGIALRQVDIKTAWPTIRRELGAGFINGLINGALVAGVVMIVDKDARIALLLAAAMITNLLVAAFFGTIIPLIMERLGKDPATSATIFITTATDVLGFLVFLGLATAVLN